MGVLGIVTPVHMLPNEEACANAAEKGFFDILQWLSEHGCPWDEKTCEEAASGGQFQILKYAHEQGCPWNSDTCKAAVSFGNLEYLKWIRANGCPWSEDVLAAYSVNEEVVKWAILDGCPVSNRAYNLIVCNRTFNLLNWLFDQNITPNEESMEYAASRSLVNVMKWLISKGFPLNSEVCDEAAKNGRLDIMQLAIDSGASYDLVNIASNASLNGHKNKELLGKPPYLQTQFILKINMLSLGYLKISAHGMKNHVVTLRRTQILHSLNG